MKGVVRSVVIPTSSPGKSANRRSQVIELYMDDFVVIRLVGTGRSRILATAVRAGRVRPGFTIIILQFDFSGIDFYYFVQLYARLYKYGNLGAVGTNVPFLVAIAA